MATTILKAGTVGPRCSLQGFCPGEWPAEAALRPKSVPSYAMLNKACRGWLVQLLGTAWCASNLSQGHPVSSLAWLQRHQSSPKIRLMLDVYEHHFPRLTARSSSHCPHFRLGLPTDMQMPKTQETRLQAHSRLKLLHAWSWALR